MEKQQDLSPFLGDISAGFPSPAEAYAEDPLDLNQLLIRRPAATFFVRAAGSSMIGAGIMEGDILVVDRSLTPRNGCIVIASVNGDFTVKYLQLIPNQPPRLLPANPRFHPICLNGTMETEIFGVVTAAIHQFQHP